MRHLLVAFVAALCSVVPIHAEQERQQPTVKIYDHEGNPIEGASVTFHFRADGADPRQKQRPLRKQVQHLIMSTRTGSDGVASFRMIDDFRFDPDAMVIVKVAYASDASDDIRSTPTSGLPPRLDPNSSSFDKALAALYDHAEVRGDYAFKPHYAFTGKSLLEQTAAIQAEQAVWCVVNLTARQAGLPARTPAIFVRGTVARPVDPRASQHRVPVPRGERVDIGVLSYARSRSASNNTVLFYLHSFEPYFNGSGVLLGSPTPRSEPEFDATLRYRPGVWRPDSAHGAIVRIDGELGLIIDTRTGPDGYSTRVPAGDYLVVRDAIPQTGLGHDHWHDGSALDTMLRLRRGEDLPHLKRITIPEDATVELSTEDFLDPPSEVPPAEAEAEDETP